MAEEWKQPTKGGREKSKGGGERCCFQKMGAEEDRELDPFRVD